MKTLNAPDIPEDRIIKKIYLIRGKTVMLDMDLALLYEVETKQLKRAVRRNIDRFPADFMFELTTEELADWRCQFGTSNREKMGLRIRPFAFTEHGVLMLASVLTSEKAIQVNIRIVRIFARMRELAVLNKDLFEKISKIENTINDHDQKILLLFEYLTQFEKAKQEEQAFKDRNPIGFRLGGDN